MPDVLIPARPVLPWSDDLGNTVSVSGGRVHLHLATPDLPPVRALDVSAALAVAVQEIAVQRITANTPTEGAHHG